jgi:hypothetical protein
MFKSPVHTCKVAWHIKLVCRCLSINVQMLIYFPTLMWPGVGECVSVGIRVLGVSINVCVWGVCEYKCVCECVTVNKGV